MKNTFKTDNSFDRRVQLCQKMRANYPNRIPVIIETIDTVRLPRNKFLTPPEGTVGHLLHEIRKNTTLHPEEAIFLFCETGGRSILLSTTELMSQVYDKYKDSDGLLYLYAAKENTFGVK